MSLSFDGSLTVNGNIRHSVGVASVKHLDVSGNIAQSNGSTSLKTLLVDGDVVVDLDTFKIDSFSNRVGIGTSAPLHKLDVNGGLGVNGEVTLLGLTSSVTSHALYYRFGHRQRIVRPGRLGRL